MNENFATTFCIVSLLFHEIFRLHIRIYLKNIIKLHVLKNLTIRHIIYIILKGNFMA